MWCVRWSGGETTVHCIRKRVNVSIEIWLFDSQLDSDYGRIIFLSIIGKTRGRILTEHVDRISDV